MSVIFGSRLRARRNELGMTLASCAATVGVTQPAWTLWEQGSREPKLDMLLSICELLSTSPDALLGLKENIGAVSVNARSGAAVAIGTGAKASAAAAKKAAPAADCRKCPYKSWGEKFRKAGGIIPGI